MGVLRFDSYDFHPTAVLDAHPDGILVVDTTGVVRYANPAAATAFETTVEAVIGRQFSVSLDERRVLEIKAAGGRTLRIRCVPTLWGARSARLVCLTDITEVRRLQQQAHDGVPASADGEEHATRMAAHLDALHEALEVLQRNAGSLGARLRASPVLLVQQAADTLADHAAALDALAPSEQMARLPELLEDLARELHQDNATALEATGELESALGRLRSSLLGLRRGQGPNATPAVPTRSSRTFTSEE